MLRDFTTEKFDIVIQAGQSNAEGSAFGDVETPWVPDPRVLYLLPDGTITAAREAVRGNSVCGNFSLTFAADYLASGRLAPDRSLLILRTAVGGTGFSEGHWTPDGPLYQRMLSMTADALALNPENDLVALLWHQGERDCRLGADSGTHYRNLMTLVTGVRQEFCAPSLPFVAGDLVLDWKQKHMEDCRPIVEAIQAVCRDCGGAFVSSEGLSSNAQYSSITHTGDSGDDIHFSRPALYSLGHRYYDAFSSLID